MKTVFFLLLGVLLAPSAFGGSPFYSGGTGIPRVEYHRHYGYEHVSRGVEYHEYHHYHDSYCHHRHLPPPPPMPRREVVYPVYPSRVDVDSVLDLGELLFGSDTSVSIRVRL